VIEPTPEAPSDGSTSSSQFDIRAIRPPPRRCGAGPIDQWADRPRERRAGATGGHYERVRKTEDGWRFRKRDFIPSRSGADPAAARAAS
jgi:hypothetical protein